jgi:2-dehydro-3-deoxygluconokinase
MSRIITFGEIMLRLNPIGYRRFVQADSFEVSYAGGEANVAVSLAGYGMNAAFVTKVPSHEIGQASINSLRRYGVDTSMILRGGPRLGVYYVEKGASQRASKVIYDRAGSSFSLVQKDEFDWKVIFKDADWFHFTGITPALGGCLPEICLEAVITAKELGLTISCDLNYRKNLWTHEQAQKVMSQLMPYVDICISNEEDADDVFGISSKNTDVNSGKLHYDGYIYVAEQLHRRFGFKKVAITLRSSISANDNIWGGMIFDGKDAYFSNNYNVHIVDRVGGGDSFAGALIYALLETYDCQKAVNFAAAASCLKHSIEQDFNLISVSEIQNLVNGNVSGRIQR